MADQGTLTPLPFWQVVDADGQPLDGALLYTYESGTSTPLPVYSDPDLDPIHELSNPVVADSAGRFVPIYLSPTSYKFILRNSAGTEIRTIDPVGAVPAVTINLDVIGTAGEALTAGDGIYLSDGSGGKVAGDWYLWDSANAYSSTTPILGEAVNDIAQGSTGSVRLQGSITTPGAVVPGSPYYVGTAGGYTASAPTNARFVGYADTISTIVFTPNPPPQTVLSGLPCQGRLTLTTGVPVTTADVTGATSVYFTPYGGNRIALYDGTATWNVRTFTEITIALGTVSSGKPYDVFAYDNMGTVACEILVWTNDSTRATALALQNGVLVKSGATTRRYLGTFYTISTTETCDSFANRYLWNYYNQKPRPMRAVAEGTDSWNYVSTTWREANTNTANRLNFVIGVAEVPVKADVIVTAQNNPGSQLTYVGIGYDATNALAAGVLNNLINGGNSQKFGIQASLVILPAVGKHFLSWIEAGDGSVTTTTYYGDNGTPLYLQSGISGMVGGG